MHNQVVKHSESLIRDGGDAEFDGMAYSVNFKLTSNLLAELDRLFPGAKFTESHYAGGVSLHPILHCERLVKEAVAYGMCDGFVVDVGGNPLRHMTLNRTNVWSMCPTLSASDLHRRKKFDESQAFMFCGHAAPYEGQDCPCSQPGTWLMVDSIYYFDIDVINQLVQRATLVAVVHDFSSSKGDFYGEASYRVSGDGTVLMDVKGSSIAYKHSALGWMRSAACYWDRKSKTGMAWYMKKVVGTSIIYSFERMDFEVPSDPVPLSATLTDESVYTSGTVAFDEVPVKGVVSLLNCKILPWGRVVVVREGSRDVEIPKRVVAHARMSSLLLPRNPETLQATARKVKEFVLRDDAIPLVDKPDIILFGTMLGFVADMKVEISILNSVLAEVDRYGEAHDTLLELRPVRVSWFWGLLYGLGGFRRANSTQNNLMTAQANNHGSLALGGPVGSTIVLPGYESVRSTKTPASKMNASFTFSYGWRKERRKGAHLIGQGIASCIPVVSCDTAINEERAIIHRALNCKLEPRVELWVRLQSLTLKNHGSEASVKGSG